MKDRDICRNRHQMNAHSFLANLHVAGRKHTQRERIYLYLSEKGSATCEELSLRLSMRYTSVSARIAELKAATWITPSGEERKTTGGEWASVLRALTAEERECLLHPKRGYRPRQAELFA
jgi:hypothetical protein